MTSPFRFLLALSLVLPAMLAADVPSAVACINETSYDENPAIQHVARAEQSLLAGKPAMAVAHVSMSFPSARADARLKDHRPGMGVDPLASRAQRVVAVALVRTEGLLAIGSEYASSTAEQRRGNLVWASGILRAYAALKNTPAVQTDLGEALSKLPETREEALRVLEGLAKKDLVTSSHGYAALAELRLAAGDRAGHDAAMKRSDAMSKTVPSAPALPPPAKSRGVARG
jgi:hypothetical protein